MLLRHGRRGHYYNRNFEWVAVQSDARNYPTIEAALEVVAGPRLDVMTLVIDYGGNRQQEFLLDAEGRAPAQLERIKLAQQEGDAPG